MAVKKSKQKSAKANKKVNQKISNTKKMKSKKPTTVKKPVKQKIQKKSEVKNSNQKSKNSKPVKKASKPVIQAKKKIVAKKVEAKTNKKNQKVEKAKNVAAKNTQKATAQMLKESAKSKAKAKSEEVQDQKNAQKKSAPAKIQTLNNVISIDKFIENKNKPSVKFKVGEYAVYPSHGVGKIIDIENMIVAGQTFSCYLMHFEKEKLTIKVPVSNAAKIGLRHMISKQEMDEVFSTLRSGIKKLKGMWSRRAQEYETKINSGEIMLLAEVLRDLTRDIEDQDRSYSERIIYETAVYRLASEYCAIYGVDFETAKDKIILTAKDKINSEGKVISAKKDDFDDAEFDNDEEVDEESEDEEDEDSDSADSDDYEDEDEDAKPRRKARA